LLLLALYNGVYNVPIFADYSSYLPDSVENAGATLSDCKERENCLRNDLIDKNEVADVIIDSGTGSNFTSNKSRETNAMSNEVPVLIQPTDRNQTHNITLNKTSISDENYWSDELVESETKNFVPSYESSDDISAKRNGNLGFTIVDDILYEDTPGILILCIVNDEGESHDIEVENAVHVRGDEITLDLDKAMQALAAFIKGEDSSLEGSLAGNEDSKADEPQRIVEDGYIFYDMGESAALSNLQIFDPLTRFRQREENEFLALLCDDHRTRMREHTLIFDLLCDERAWAVPSSPRIYKILFQTQLPWLSICKLVCTWHVCGLNAEDIVK
jgi:hypothetical protein